MISRSDLDAAKDRFRIPDLWRILNLRGEPITRDGVKFSSPLRPDVHPSCSFYDGGKRLKDWSTDRNYDAIDFLREALGIEKGEAIRRFLDIANSRQVTAAPTPIIRAEEKVKARRPDVSDLRKASRAELQQIAGSRNIDVRAAQLAQDLGTLRVGEVCGYPSWVLLDTSGLCAEGRRLNRKPYPAIANGKVQLSERKAHTLRGSRKDWPVGIVPTPEYRNSFERIVIVEGGPDYLAALHFALAQKRLKKCESQQRLRTGVLPVAILGRGQGLRGLHPESLQHFRGRRVRILPHEDPDGGSYESALRWAKQLREVGAEVDFFHFKNLQTSTGKRVKDLNDCCELAPAQSTELEGLFS
jgi:hypothetical protein